MSYADEVIYQSNLTENTNFDRFSSYDSDTWNIPQKSMFRNGSFYSNTAEKNTITNGVFSFELDSMQKIVAGETYNIQFKISNFLIDLGQERSDKSVDLNIRCQFGVVAPLVEFPGDFRYGPITNSVIANYPESSTPYQFDTNPAVGEASYKYQLRISNGEKATEELWYGQPMMNGIYGFNYTAEPIDEGGNFHFALNVFSSGATDWDGNPLSYLTYELGDFKVTRLSSVPEPSVAVLGGLGALLLLRRRRVG